MDSLLFEAAGRTVNPVNGAVGLLWTGNWHVCQAAVETVLRGGALRPIPAFLGGSPLKSELYEASEVSTEIFKTQDPSLNSRSTVQKRRRSDQSEKLVQFTDLDLSLTPVFPATVFPEKPRPGTPSRNSEESVTTACCENGFGDHRSAPGGEPKLLNLFN
ncbi:unnamed protein product [Ilex paraguariensis]|uniref:LOB domain-containing protein n=1 Tax=Ilex paraguariensis TaxID=185542 RepID=A0ABC8UYY5_9AQUA